VFAFPTTSFEPHNLRHHELSVDSHKRSSNNSCSVLRFSRASETATFGNYATSFLDQKRTVSNTFSKPNVTIQSSVVCEEIFANAGLDFGVHSHLSSRSNQVRILLEIAAFFNLDIMQIDCEKEYFLNGDSDILYMFSNNMDSGIQHILTLFINSIDYCTDWNEFLGAGFYSCADLVIHSLGFQESSSAK
jgi:hypothetical protein